MGELFAKECHELKEVAKRCERISAMLTACNDEQIAGDISEALAAIADVVEKDSVTVLLVSGRIKHFGRIT